MLYALITLWLGFIAVMGDLVPPDPVPRKQAIALGPGELDLSWCWEPITGPPQEPPMNPLPVTEAWRRAIAINFAAINHNIQTWRQYA